MKEKLRMGKKITFRVVPNGATPIRSFKELDGLITVDVYEGYKKLGRFSLQDAKLKFR